MESKVYIVGGGPGDPGLLTVKAYQKICEADVILYDRLVNSEILELAKPNCEMVYVGKDDGKHLLKQDEINELIVYFAKKLKNIVRLKGGDPFVFGRGGEEALFLKENKIPFEVIPGVTSAVSAPAYAGIPVTHRGLAASCLIITGHEAPHKKKNIDWEGLKSVDTIVFLMGVTNKQPIARKLIEIGRDPSEPVAFIEKGTSLDQEVTISTLDQVLHAPPIIAAPAIFIVGEVVRLREELKWFGEDSSQFDLKEFARFLEPDEGHILS